MSSPLRSIGNPAQFDVMFWLPPGGTDNGVWASAWAELADLEPGDVGPLLTLRRRGHRRLCSHPGRPLAVLRVHGQQRLWVDSLQYHRAEDVLMNYLRSRVRQRRPTC